MVDQVLLGNAIAIYKSGDRQSALTQLLKIVRDDPKCDGAWVWISACTDKVEQKRFALNKALEANPDNAYATRGLNALSAAESAAAPSLDEIVGKPVAAAVAPAAARSVTSVAPEVYTVSWYRTAGFKILTFLFLTPVWTIIVLTDRRDSMAVKIVAVFVLIFYFFVLWTLFIQATAHMLY